MSQEEQRIQSDINAIQVINQEKIKFVEMKNNINTAYQCSQQILSKQFSGQAQNLPQPAFSNPKSDFFFVSSLHLRSGSSRLNAAWHGGAAPFCPACPS